MKPLYVQLSDNRWYKIVMRPPLFWVVLNKSGLYSLIWRGNKPFQIGGRVVP